MPAPQPTVFCPAGQWTKVVWSSHLFKQYTGSFSVGGVVIQWRRASTLPPWYTEGGHNTSQLYGAIVAGVYCDFHFLSPVSLSVTWV